MKRSIFLGFFLLLLSSCNQDDPLTYEDNITLRDQASTDEEIIDEALLNFYNEDYIVAGYGLQDQHATNVDVLINKVYFSPNSTEFAITSAEFLGAPCWHCARFQAGVDNNYYLIPVVNTNENLVKAVLFVPDEQSYLPSPVLVDILSLELDIFDVFDPIVSDFENLFVSKSWNFVDEEIQTRGESKLPKIGCYEKCPNGHSIEKCRHPRDCDNTENPGDETAKTYIYIWTIIMGVTNPSDIITNFPGGGKNGQSGGPSGISEPDGEFYATMVGQLTEAILDLEHCLESLQDAKNILSALNGQFPQIDFNENIDYTFSNMFGNLNNGNPSSTENLMAKAAQGAVAMSVASALSNQDLETQLEVIDAINSISCNTDGSNDNSDDFNEEDCINAIEDFEAKYGLNLNKAEIILLKGVDPCGNDGIDEEEAAKILMEKRYDVEINNVYIIDGIIFGKDSDGILHIVIENLPDPGDLTPQELFDHVFFVLNCVNLYFCETLVYDPIDWNDYFVNVNGGSYVVNWDDNVTFQSCPVTMLIDFTWGGNLMDTDPAQSGQTSDVPPVNHWKWNGVDTDAALLQISTKSIEDCKDILYNFFNPDCN